MSKISTIYDNLGTLVAATLTGYKHIPNPFTGLIYGAKSYGIGIGDGQRLDLSTGQKRGFSRTFTVTIVNQVTATDHDLTGRSGLEKALAEDFILLHNAVESQGVTGASLINYVSDTGIDFLATDGGKFKYIANTITFLVEYEETLS